MSKCTFPACSCRATGQYCKDKPVKKTGRKAIPKRSAKGILNAAQKKTLVNEDMLFYIEKVWDVRAHKCCCGDPTCNKPIYEPRIWNFHHLLPKRLYPSLRHHPTNILLLSRECHDAWERNPDTKPTITEIAIMVYGLLVEDRPNITLKEILRS